MTHLAWSYGEDMYKDLLGVKELSLFHKESRIVAYMSSLQDHTGARFAKPLEEFMSTA